MMNITEAVIKSIAPNYKNAFLLADILNKFIGQYGINSNKRIAAFLAQAAHETGEFKWFTELEIKIILKI